jgi:hypothetical protein
MHTRRMATFLLGAWLGCSVFMAFLVVENLRWPARLTVTPPRSAARILKQLGPEDAELLLRYQAVEQNRAYLAAWELVQFGVGGALAAFLFLGTQRRIFPLVLCGAMLVMVGFEHFALSPELAFRGRAADFPPRSRTFSVQVRAWAIEEMYIGMEGAKLLTGGVLASYLFVFRTGRGRYRNKVQPVDDPDHSHVDG